MPCPSVMALFVHVSTHARTTIAAGMKVAHAHGPNHCLDPVAQTMKVAVDRGSCVINQVLLHKW
jgi:hypothetical protein